MPKMMHLAPKKVVSFSKANQFSSYELPCIDVVVSEKEETYSSQMYSVNKKRVISLYVLIIATRLR